MNTLGLISFFVLSLHWPQLMEYWQSVESLPIFQNVAHKTAYIRRIRFVAATVLLLAFGTSCVKTQRFLNWEINFKLLTYTQAYTFLVEHCLFIGVTIKSNIMYHNDKDILLGLIRRMVPNLIPLENPPPNYIALTFCYISENTAFMWNFVDIFIMIIGIGLTTHFKVLNNELQRTNFQTVVKKIQKSEVWRSIYYLCFSGLAIWLFCKHANTIHKIERIGRSDWW